MVAGHHDKGSTSYQIFLHDGACCDSYYSTKVTEEERKNNRLCGSVEEGLMYQGKIEPTSYFENKFHREISR